MVGVLATGGAAFAANTTVLDSVTSSLQVPPTLVEAIVPFANLSIGSTATGGVVVAVNTTVLDSTASSVPTDTSVPETQVLVGPTTSVVAAVTPQPTVVPATDAPTSGQSAYNIPGVGIISLKYDSTSLKIISVIPVSGWTYDAEYRDATRVEIEFENDSRSVVFRAELLDGRVVTAISANDGDDGDAETTAKVVADAAEKLAKATYDATVIAVKATYDATVIAAKATYDATEKAAKATYDVTESAAKEAFESAEREAKENSDDDALAAAKDEYESALKTAKETFENALIKAKVTFETALSTAIETFENALSTAKEALESADD